MHQYLIIRMLRLKYNCIIEFTDLKEFSEIKLSAELYHNMLPAIKDNFNQVMNYKSTDDIIALKLKEIFKL